MSGTPMRMKHVGVDSFFAEKAKLLDSYNRAKDQNAEEPVQVDHGVVAESLVRRWLRAFLPKRFGVTKGYIITPSLGYEGALEEWDVIIYDALESPILYTKGDPESELKQAIPVEHVRGVIEVKATLTPENAKKSTSKLLKLRQFIDQTSTAEYPATLQLPFISTTIFMESKVRTINEYRQALDAFIPLYIGDFTLPYLGALILRSQVNPIHVGYITAMRSDVPMGMNEDVFELSSEYIFPDGSYGKLGCLTWGVNHYPSYIFDLLACLRGKKTMKASSFYGLDLENTQGSRLFH